MSATSSVSNDTASADCGSDGGESVVSSQTCEKALLAENASRSSTQASTRASGDGCPRSPALSQKDAVLSASVVPSVDGGPVRIPASNDSSPSTGDSWSAKVDEPPPSSGRPRPMSDASSIVPGGSSSKDS